MARLASHFEHVDFPVELALPHRVDDFLRIADRMAEVRDFVLGRGIEVLSVHAAQGKLSADDYAKWAEPAMQLADEIGAKSVTFHPNQSKHNRQNDQISARRHLRALQRGRLALAAVETFGGHGRVLRPEEIVAKGLPLVLDTSHIHDDERIRRLIREYHQNIPAVHLSARTGSEQHLPIDAFCLEVVGLLQTLKWTGSVILEYLPWHHYRTKADLRLIERFLHGEQNLEIPPPDDRFKDEPDRWGYGDMGDG